MFFPYVHEFAVVVYRLKNRGVGQFLFQTAFADHIDFFFLGIRKNLHEFFFALWTVVGSIYHLFCVFNENFYSIMWSPV